MVASLMVIKAYSTMMKANAQYPGYAGVRAKGPVTGAPTFIRNLTLPVIPEVGNQEFLNPAFEEDEELDLEEEAHPPTRAPEPSSPVSSDTSAAAKLSGILRKNGIMSHSNHTPASGEVEFALPASVHDENSSTTVTLETERNKVDLLDSGYDLAALAPQDMVMRKSSIADIALALRANTRRDSFTDWMQVTAPYRALRGKPRYEHPFGRSSTIMDALFPAEEEVTSVQEKEKSNDSGSMAKFFIWVVFTLFMVGVAGAIILGAESFERSTSNDTSTVTPGNSFTVSQGVQYSRRGYATRRRYTSFI